MGAAQALAAHRCPRAGVIAAAKTKLTLLLCGWLGVEAPPTQYTCRLVQAPEQSKALHSSFDLLALHTVLIR